MTDDFMTHRPRPAKARAAPQGLEKNPCFWLGVLEAVGEVSVEQGQERIRLIGYKGLLNQFADILLECHLGGSDVRKRDDAARNAAYYRGMLEADPSEGMRRERLEINAEEDAWHEIVLEGVVARAITDFLSLCKPGRGGREAEKR